MITTPHIIQPTGIVAFVDGVSHQVSSESTRYKAVLAAFQSEDDEAFQEAFRATEVEALSATAGVGFELVDGVIQLDGVTVIGALQEKLVRMIHEDLPIQQFVNFLRRLRKNPSRAAVGELYDFLAYAELPITEDGFLLAYKGVQDDYWSCRGGNTVLTSGKVNKSGQIFNGVGEDIRCERNEVDDDRRNCCSNGIHVGSHDYARAWGPRTVVVKVDPADVVSVPLDCQCQKMRVCAYSVLADYKSEIKTATVTATGQEVKSKRDELAKTLNSKITNCRKRGGRVTLKRLQSAFSPDTPPVHVLRDVASRDLGYTVAIDPDEPTSVGAMFIA